MPVIPPDIILDLLYGRETDGLNSDYRPMPKSDTGATYVDQGMLGWYSPDTKPFEPPPGVKWFEGYGATVEDLKRGYSEPRVTNHPAYDLANYKDRMSSPDFSDVEKGDVEAVPSDIEFRGRHRQSRGLLTRPRIPKDRG